MVRWISPRDPGSRPARSCAAGVRPVSRRLRRSRRHRRRSRLRRHRRRSPRRRTSRRRTRRSLHRRRRIHRRRRLRPCRLPRHGGGSGGARGRARPRTSSFRPLCVRRPAGRVRRSRRVPRSSLRCSTAAWKPPLPFPRTGREGRSFPAQAIPAALPLPTTSPPLLTRSPASASACQFTSERLSRIPVPALPAPSPSGSARDSACAAR